MAAGMPEKQGLALAFDFGLARIGVAVGSLEAATAHGLDVVPVRRGVVDWAAVDRLVATWRPDHLVVGEPQAQVGGDRRLLQALRRFCAELATRYRLPVSRINEDYTSACARAELRARRQAGGRRRTLRGETDKMAAAYILNTWLSERDAVTGKD